MGKHLVVGIEGPAAAGKSTMALTVGREMGIPVVEGGRFFRQLTLLALKEKVDASDTKELSRLAKSIPTRFAFSEDGSTELDGEDISEQLQGDIVSKNVAIVSQNLEVRKIIDEQIIGTVNQHPKVIIVGRHLRRFYPTAVILQIVIDPDLANKRHRGRTGNTTGSVNDRNARDAKTSQLLGVDTNYDMTVDVTNLTLKQQANVLKDFITSRLEM